MYKLPDGYTWCSLDLRDDGTINMCYEFLRNNYVSNSSGTVRFNYSREFIRWAMLVPGYKKDWHVGVLANGKLCGCIFGIPVKMGPDQIVCEINFLCVHKKLRSMRLAPVLIKEITRRVNSEGIYTAVYTAGKELSTSLKIPTKYYLRGINIKKLVDINFMDEPMDMSVYDVCDTVITPGWRKMETKDIEYVHCLLNEYLKRYKLHTYFTIEDIAHIFIPITNVVHSYVVETNGVVTDFASFYCIPSRIFGTKYTMLYSAYSYYVVPGKCTLTELMRNMLVEAKLCNKDMFISLNIMDNQTTFKELNYSAGDTVLYYYLLGPDFDAKREDIGIVLV